jgi:hypothetical protein
MSVEWSVEEMVIYWFTMVKLLIRMIIPSGTWTERSGQSPFVSICR